MKWTLLLHWPQKAQKKWFFSFKHAEYAELVRFYEDRIAKKGQKLIIESNQSSFLKYREDPTTQLCVFDLGKKALEWDSEGFAQKIDKISQRGVKNFVLCIGPPDGFNKKDINALRSHDWICRLSQMTMTHELAAVVVMEQLYRAQSILRGEPYHLGH